MNEFNDQKLRPIPPLRTTGSLDEDRHTELGEKQITAFGHVGKFSNKQRRSTCHDQTCPCTEPSEPPSNNGIFKPVVARKYPQPQQHPHSVFWPIGNHPAPSPQGSDKQRFLTQTRVSTDFYWYLLSYSMNTFWLFHQQHSVGWQVTCNWSWLIFIERIAPCHQKIWKMS